MAEYPEIELARDFFNGENKAFEEIYRQYYNRLYIFCRKFINNQEEARDIAVQTLTKLFKRHRDFDNLPDIRVFLYVAARNKCFDYLRYLKLLTAKQKLFLQSFNPEAEASTEELYGDLLKAVRKEIELLPERSKAVIKLLYDEGLKYREVADRLDISVKTVDSQREYGLKLLKKLLSEKQLIAIGLVHICLCCFNIFSIITKFS